LDQAVALATRAHEGQTDKAGEPYIGHPLRAMRYVATDPERLVAVLHDVLEDTPVTAMDLLRQGCPAGVVVAVQLLSKRAEDTYETFIERTRDSGNELAINVKLADLADNADMSRLIRL